MKKLALLISFLALFSCNQNENLTPSEFATAIINGEEFTSKGGDGLHLVPSDRYLVFLIKVENGERYVTFSIGLLPKEGNIFERVYDSYTNLIWSQTEEGTRYREELTGTVNTNWIGDYGNVHNLYHSNEEIINKGR